MKRDEWRLTRPFTGNRTVVITMIVQGSEGAATASCCRLSYSRVHELEEMIRDYTAEDPIEEDTDEVHNND